MMDNEILKKELEQYATSTATLFSRFRIIFCSSVIKQMNMDLLEKKTPAHFIMKLNHDNILYVIPSSDKVTLVYGINFSQKTDISLARVFLGELSDAKRHTKNAVEANNYPDFSKPPMELKDIESNAKQFSCGMISFSNE